MKKENPLAQFSKPRPRGTAKDWLGVFGVFALVASMGSCAANAGEADGCINDRVLRHVVCPDNQTFPNPFGVSPPLSQHIEDRRIKR